MKVKTHKRRKHRKSNPAKSRKTTTHRRRRRHNPAAAPSAHRRRHTRRRRHNPSGGLMELGLTILAGIGSAGASAVVNNMASKWVPVKYRGGVSLVAGTAAAFIGRKNKYAVTAGIVAAAVGGWDLLRQNIPALAPFSAEDAGYLLGSAAADDPDLAQMLGAINSAVPGVIPNFGYDETGSIPLGASNSSVPSVVQNFGDPTQSIPLGEDMESDGLFSDDLLL